MDDRVPSDCESVYLIAHYDRLYTKRVVEHHGGSSVAIVVNVPLSSLAADESALSPHASETLPPDEQLYRSLCFGACKHPGVIPVTNFLGIYDSEGEKIQ